MLVNGVGVKNEGKKIHLLPHLQVPKPPFSRNGEGLVLSELSNHAGGFRMKVIKSYSLDLQTAQLLEMYPSGKKSEIVNEALKWYLGNEHIGEKIDLMQITIDALREEVRTLRRKRESVLRRTLRRMREYRQEQ